MKKQRNKFLTFIFSCVPGAGQMFMGFMNRGLILMAAFFLPIFLGFAISGDVVIFSAIVWFYAFFDSINLAWADADSFERESDDIEILNRAVGSGLFSKHKGAIGVILILVGVWQLLEKFSAAFFDGIYRLLGASIANVFYDLPKIFVCFIIIGIGIRLIAGKKKEIDKDE